MKGGREERYEKESQRKREIDGIEREREKARKRGRRENGKGTIEK